MKNWPLKFTVRIISSFVVSVFAWVGLNTMIYYFMIKEVIDGDSIGSFISSGIGMTLLFMWMDSLRWKRRLARYKEEEQTVKVR